MEGVRPVGPDDLPACARLLEAALDAATHLRGGPQLLAACRLDDATPSDVVRDWALGDGGHHLLAGTFEGEIVGLSAGHCSAEGTDPIGVVDCCYVEAEARGVGVGTALVRALLSWFEAQGCRSVDAAALPGDRATKQLFESQGLSARLLVLHRRLP